MPPAKLLLLAALALAPAHAQQAPNPSAAVQPPKPLAIPKGRVSGHVICNDTRGPARGALVMLQLLPREKGSEAEPTERVNGMPIARAAADGTYSIEHLAAGDYALLAFLPGYLSTMDDFVLNPGDEKAGALLRKRFPPSSIIKITRGVAQSADILLERGASVSGRVLYSDGSPASQANIIVDDTSVKPASPGNSEQNSDMDAAMFRVMFTHQSSSADDQGHFRIAGIKPGTYRIAAVPPVELSGMDDTHQDDGGFVILITNSADPKSIRFYAGDTIHRAAAKTFTLRTGDTLDGIEIRLPLDGFHTVHVRLTSTDARPISQAALTLTDTADDTLVFTARHHDDGLFDISGVPPGTYTLRVTSAFIHPTPDTPPMVAFADATATVLVKDCDPPEVLVALKEIPLPKQTEQD